MTFCQFNHVIFVTFCLFFPFLSTTYSYFCSGKQPHRQKYITQPHMKKGLTYLILYLLTVLIMVLIPMPADSMWDPALIISASAALITLLIYLSAQLLGTDNTPGEIVFTGLFILFFLPGANTLFLRDEVAILDLGSQCIVPFFLMQYERARKKPFSGWYILMLLMGIFCSYTHDGITIPLCAGFLWMSFLQRDTFFRTACWPMVVGFVLGTSLSIWQAIRHGESGAFADYTSQTMRILGILWDTKIFLLAMGLTIYLNTSRHGRKRLLYIFRHHELLGYCGFFALILLPFAPLGIENAATGVCFFGMYWAILMIRSIAHRIQIRGKSR